MLMLKALRHHAIRRLWFGQALSSVGDEIYRVGLTWIAVGIIGADTGFLNAAQFAALMIVSFVGGKWADHWDPMRTMLCVDLLRAVIVLIPVGFSYYAEVPLSLLIGVAIVLSGLAAFFDPALQAALPSFSPTREVLLATNGLMMTTIRLARMVGPGIVGALAGIVPPIHFFTLDGLSYLFSFLSLNRLPKPTQHLSAPKRKLSLFEAVNAGFQAVSMKKGMPFIVIAKAVTAATWNLSFILGFALLVQELASYDTRSFGMVMATYGLGNFAGALYFGNRDRRRPALMMFIGFIWLGVGFIAAAYAVNIPWLMAAVAFAGFSGTMNEVTFFDMVQTRFPVGDITKVIRLRMANDNGATLILMLLAPFMFKNFGVRPVIAACGVIWIITGIIGLVGYQKLLDHDHSI